MSFSISGEVIHVTEVMSYRSFLRCTVCVIFMVQLLFPQTFSYSLDTSITTYKYKRVITFCFKDLEAEPTISILLFLNKRDLNFDSFHIKRCTTIIRSYNVKYIFFNKHNYDINVYTIYVYISISR